MQNTANHLNSTRTTHMLSNISQPWQGQVGDIIKRAPPHRHSAPSAPWPWLDLRDEVDRAQLDAPSEPVPPLCDHRACEGLCWRGYPQSCFPNWTHNQVTKSGIAGAIQDRRRCIIYYLDVNDSGIFTDPKEALVVDDSTVPKTWNILVASKRPANNCVRALFVENMSGPVLQMLGTRYNIEPFFFSSSLNWIPSRYQEDVQPGVGDHITITMSFLRSIIHDDSDGEKDQFGSRVSATPGKRVIDTASPLPLGSGSEGRLELVLDLLSVHLIRNIKGNTIISYHAKQKFGPDKTTYLRDRIQFAGRSVYWQSIFKESSDPTFILLCYVWHALYAWDEALEHLYSHICQLEANVVEKYDIHLTEELHRIRAHQLHYSSLLNDFRKTVEFIRATHNPAIASSFTTKDKNFTEAVMDRECQNLLNEIKRLELDRTMQDKRLKNVMDLVFSSVNIEDSQRVREMTEAAVRDSAGMSSYKGFKWIF
ncbi:hypothetical protein BD779DRAFT_1548833 [Infundibulicybe gibba]|nr:hypothetical protein BD779DRAFT_1548833 [Infundibulicybe gibba]